MFPSRRSLLHRKTPSGQANLWYLHYSRSHTDGQPVETELGYLRFFATQATHLGIRLEVLTNGEGEADVVTELAQPQLAELDYRVVVSETPVLKWAEDSTEYLLNGVVALPLVCDEDALRAAMTAGRRARWQRHLTPELLEPALTEDHLWIPLGVSVNDAKMVQQQRLAAQLRGQTTQSLPIYIEGGNMIVGEDADNRTIVLIGKDAIDASTKVQGMTGEQLKELLVKAFQLEDPAQIIEVEQPGQFHLDMGLLFLGQGRVVVNDSTVALLNAKEMAELAPCTTTETMASLLQIQHTLEAIAVVDLEAAGLQVMRENLANGVYCNFCNGEFIASKTGQNYYITNGTVPETETHFRKLMVQTWQVVDDVIFSPRELTHKSLQERGGVGCRIKGTSLLLNH
ncbi:MAG: hypothetical protein AAGG02_09810 [Cyanobacteria bacterium P01_H01_bin.15]